MRHAIENIKASRKSRNSDNLVWGMLHKRQNMDILILRDLPIFFFSFSFFTVCNLHDLQLKSIIWQDICKVVWNFQVLLQHVETIFSSSLCYFGGVFFWWLFIFVVGVFLIFAWCGCHWLREKERSTCMKTASEMECNGFTQQSCSIASSEVFCIDEHWCINWKPY